MPSQNAAANARVFTPRETVSELDRYIIGQQKAKRAVAIALRNRWRRQNVPPELRDEIAPKNIIMIGPTGVGKTEIARRLAKLSQAPFLKIEASKFTEVGYVGRDVESMIRDLMEIGVHLVKAEEAVKVKASAERTAEDRLLDLLMLEEPAAPGAMPPPVAEPGKPRSVFAVGPDGQASQLPVAPDPTSPEARRARLREQLRAGELDDRWVTLRPSGGGAGQVPIGIQMPPGFEGVPPQGLDDMMSNLKEAMGNLGNIFGGKGRRERKARVPQAREQLVAEESEKLVDQEKIVSLALERVQQTGIVFLDEIDKIASRGGGSAQGPDVSRGGVQRDLLPIVEGSAVTTKYGVVKTDHILFIAAGAFHEVKVSDLIPELQGRFPIRVELETLGQAEFLRILSEPANSLVKQYQELLKTERVTLDFTPDGLHEIARVAFEANARLENIGARRLHTVMEALLEEASFKAPEMGGQTVTVDAGMVKDKLGPVLADEDLSRYIL
jgi:ATP-dependent HslUV protease ATP-binding subunit HslU